MSASKKVVAEAVKYAKPVLSLDKAEAKRKVLGLYKAWYRHIPQLVYDYNLSITVKKGRDKVRENFNKNRHATDIRVIDLLVVKGRIELVEVVKKFKLESHVMMYFDEALNPKPKDFLTKFYDGHN